MNSMPRFLTKFAIAALIGFGAFPSSTFAASEAWSFGATPSEDWNTSGNWSNNIIPGNNASDIATFNGSAGGTGAITFGAATGGANGISLSVLGTQTSAVGITSTVANSTFRISGGITIASGAGAFSLGTSGSTLALTLGNGGGTYTLTNNSGNVATIGSQAFIQSGGTGSALRVLSVGGTGNWSITPSTIKNNVNLSPVAVSKTGVGTLTLGGANTYTGTTTIQGGILNATTVTTLGFGGANGLGNSGSTTIGGSGATSASTLDLAGVGAGTVQEAIFVNGSAAAASLIVSTGSATIGNGVAEIDITTGGGGTGATGTTIGFSGGGGSGAAGTFTQTSGAVTTTTITNAGSGYASAPTLTFGAGSGVAATAVLSSVTLTGTNNSIGGAGNLTLLAAIGQTASGAGFTKIGAGTLTLKEVTANTYTGATLVNGGELDLNNSGGIAVSGPLTIGDTTGAANADVVKLLATNQILATGAITVNNDGQLALNGKTNTTVSYTSNGGDITSATAGGILTVNTAPAFSGTGNKIDTGATIHSTTAATLASGGDLTVNGTLDDSLTTGTSTVTGTGSITGAVSLSGGNTLSSTGTLQTGGLSVSGTGNAITAGTVSGGGTVNSGGAISLSSGATWTGAVTINGTVTALSTASLGAGGALTVNGGGTLAGANSSVVHTQSFNIAGTGSTGPTQAHLLVGHTDGSDLNTTGTMSLEAVSGGTFANAKLEFNLNTLSGSPTSNVLNIGGTAITFSSGSGVNTTLSLNLQGGGLINANTDYVLVAGNGSAQYDGLSLGTVTSLGSGITKTLILNSNFGGSGNLNLTFNGDNGSYGSNSYLFLYQNSNTGQFDIEVEIVPEPGTWAMMVAGLAVLVLWQRRRGKSC